MGVQKAQEVSMLASLAAEIGGMPSLEPFVGIITLIIGCTFVIVLISMFKGFFTKGMSVAIADWLLKNCPEDTATKLIRWFGDSDTVMEEWKKTREVLERNELS